jgi:hypothetical protein
MDWGGERKMEGPPAVLLSPWQESSTREALPLPKSPPPAGPVPHSALRPATAPPCRPRPFTPPLPSSLHQVRALHAHRLVELGRHRAARQPHSDDALPPIAPAPVAPAPAAATPAPPPGVPSSSSSVAAALSPGPDAPSIVTVSIRPPVPPRPSLAALHLPLFALHPDTHAAAAAASAHSCAATLCLRVALVSWLSRKRLPFACLHGTSPPANSLKLEAVSHCAQAAGLTALTSRQLVAAWLLREVPMAVAVPYDEEGEEHHGQQLQPTWAPLDGDAPPTPATPVAPPAFLVPLPTAAAAAAAAAAHAPTLAASPTPAAPSPASPFAPAPELLSLIDGTRVGFIGATEDQRQAVWDGAVMVRGKYDGEASGASFEPGPWRYDAKAGADGKGERRTDVSAAVVVVVRMVLPTPSCHIPL